MVQRQFWLQRLEELWRKRSVVWLSGVRRAGKTVLCQSLPSVVTTPADVTFLIVPLPLSATKTLAALSTATPEG